MNISPRSILAKALEPAVQSQLALIKIAERAGLKLGRITKATKAYPISASDHLRACAAISIDPDTGEDCKAPPPGEFEFKALGAGVTMRRIQRGDDKSIRQTAEAMGVAHSTFLKIERGEVTSIDSVLAACRYIGISPFAYVKHPSWSSDCSDETITRPPVKSASSQEAA